MNQEVENTLCRLCADCVEENCTFSNLDKDSIPVEEKIFSIFGKEMFEEFPIGQVCLNCCKVIEGFYSFYTRVLHNNEHFCKVHKKVHIHLNVPCDVREEKYCSSTLNLNAEETPSYGVISNIEYIDENRNIDLEIAESTLDENNDHEQMTIRKKTEDDIPEHLKVRTSKARGDAQIKQFMGISCTMCESKTTNFDTFKELQLHYQIAHNTRGYVVCCNKKLYRKDRVMDHIINHINPDAFKCPKCGQKSKSKVLLRIHMKQHLPVAERPFKCEKCEQRFVLRSQLTNHEATHLTNDQKKFVCDECGKAFALKFVLIKHMLTHSKEKKFFCEICAKPFSCKNSLMSHTQKHESEQTQPRIQCHDCGQWYKNIQTLRTHIHRHKDTRKHICQTCGRQCTSKSSLSAHIRYVHMKITEYECNICQKRFRRKLELTEHTARHTGEVLYACPFCPKTFFSSSNFFSHRKNKHPNELVKCSTD